MNKSLILLMSLLLMFTGCATYSGRSELDVEQGELQPPRYESAPPVMHESVTANLMGTYFDDIEVPALMKSIKDESLILDTANFIGGSLTYIGPLGLEQLIKFFKERMLKKGWSFEGISYTKNNSILAFLKPNKNCIIYISSMGSWGKNVTRLQVWISNIQSADIRRPPYVEPAPTLAPVKPRQKEKIKEEFLLDE
ncbi:MAG: hypothetical protein L3V56_06495 [Candidatus Magnetoovum sp. WYHC-5]|nr:hypothetical protein [Candidatus Magnetoovum sp. WYHC-5]